MRLPEPPAAAIRVVSVQQASKVGGIRCDNLFTWNSIMLCLRGRFEGVFVEYVHIRAASCRVKEGDEVKVVIGSKDAEKLIHLDAVQFLPVEK